MLDRCCTPELDYRTPLLTSIYLLEDAVLPCNSPGWPAACYIAQTGLELFIFLSLPFQCLYYRQSTLHLAFGSFSSLQLEEQDVQVSKLCLMTLPLDPRGVALLCGLLIFNF